MERLQNTLFEAAAKGCITSLHQLLIEDPLILDRVVVNSFNETPLHVAAMLGHIDFVKEIIRIKPELTNELNSQRSAPLHLASAKGHVDVARALLSIDQQMCLARNRNGLTPLHLAAIKGRDEVMKLLLEAQPDAARLMVYREETILHLCVKNYQLEALKLLLMTISEPEFLNAKDADGNTILHLAVEDKQVETTKFLVAAPAIEVNELNHEGLSAVDVLIRSRRDVRDSEIEESLRNGGGVVSTNISPNMAARDDGPSSSTQVKTKTSEGLMVVAILVASMAFQIGVNPPGGVWQDDNFLVDSQGNPVDSQGKRMLYAVDAQNHTVRYPHQAGYSVLARNNPAAYRDFCTSNTQGFFATLYIILMLMSGLPLSNDVFMSLFVWITYFAVTAIVDAYVAAVKAVTPKEMIGDLSYTLVVNSEAWHILAFLFVCFNSFRVLVRCCRRRRAVTSAAPDHNVVV